MGIDYLKLQNGSDIRGIAVGDNINLTATAVSNIAASFVLFLSKKLNKNVSELKIGVGHDSRISADKLTKAAIEGIFGFGATAFDCSLTSTPAMFMSLIYKETSFDGSIMITASHMPSDRNGMKFFDKDGGLEKTDITEILNNAESICLKENDKIASKIDLMSLYSKDLREKIIKSVNNGPLPLKGLKIVTDCGNGAGGFFARDVLEPLGADISGSQFLNPDGLFPNHIPNPEDKVAMSFIKKATIDNKADLGLIFDTDVDRMSAVLSDGTELNRDALIAIISAIIAEKYSSGTIVTDSVTSEHLTDFLENIGLKHHRFKRGYKNVINESKRLNSIGIVSPLAIETSGHGALIENYFLDDGAYLAVKLVIALALTKMQDKNIESLIDKFVMPFEVREYRIPITSYDFKTDGQKAIDTFEKSAPKYGLIVATPNYEGVRVSSKNGWMLLRLSLHEPLLPLNIEGNGFGDVEKLTKIAFNILSTCDNLDMKGFNL